MTHMMERVAVSVASDEEIDPMCPSEDAKIILAIEARIKNSKVPSIIDLALVPPRK